jgi:Leucine-rich repeat (LRR) protein
MPKWLIICFLISPFNSGFSSNGEPCDFNVRKGKVTLTSDDLSKLDKLCTCEEIEEVLLRKTSLVRLPGCLLEIPGLKKLNLAKSALRELPSVEGDSQLEELDLSFTKISSLPESLGNLSNLKILKIRGTSITNLPAGLDHLEKIDMRMIDLNKTQQRELRAQYPNITIFFSSPCNCM